MSAQEKDFPGDENTMNGSGNKRGEPPSKRQKVDEHHKSPTTSRQQLSLTDDTSSTSGIVKANVASTPEKAVLINMADFEYIEQPEFESVLELLSGPAASIEQETARVAIEGAEPTGDPSVDPAGEPGPESSEPDAEPAAELTTEPAVADARMQPTPPAPTPAFSYRAEAAQQQQQFPSSAHSAHTYDYTDEGDFALERALAANGQPSEGVEQPSTEVVEPSAGVVQPPAEVEQPSAEVVQLATEVVQPHAEVVQSSAEVVQLAAEVVQPPAELVQPSVGVVQPPAEVVQPPAEAVQPSAGVVQLPVTDDPSLNNMSVFHELEQGFSLERFEGDQFLMNPPLVEYAENGAKLQSELFELGQRGFIEPEPSVVEENLLGAEDNTPPVQVPATAADPDFAHADPTPVDPTPSDPAPALDDQDDRVSFIEQELLPAVEQPGPSRPRAHAVQLYPRGGEGEPCICYITNLPKLDVEPAFFDEGPSRLGPMPLQARPVQSNRQTADILEELLGVPEDDEGDVPPSPTPLQLNISEDSSEPDKENTPDTISVALRSAAIAFAAQINESVDSSPEPAVFPAKEDDDAVTPAKDELTEDNEAASVTNTLADNSVTAAKVITPAEDNEAASVPIYPTADDVTAAEIFTPLFDTNASVALPPLDDNEAAAMVVTQAGDNQDATEAVIPAIIQAEDEKAIAVAVNPAEDNQAVSGAVNPVITPTEDDNAVAMAVTPAEGRNVTPVAITPDEGNETTTLAITPGEDDKAAAMDVASAENKVTGSMTITAPEDDGTVSIAENPAITPAEDNETASVADSLDEDDMTLAETAAAVAAANAAAAAAAAAVGAAVEPATSKLPKKSVSKKNKRKRAATDQPATTTTRKPKVPKKVRAAPDNSANIMVLRSRQLKKTF